MVTFFKHGSRQKRGGFLHHICLSEAIYLLGNNSKKEKGEKKKKASTKSYTLAGSLENMPVIQARYPLLFLKGCLVCFLLFVFIKKGPLISFHVDLMAFLTYEMEMVARVIASLPSKVVLMIH